MEAWQSQLYAAWNEEYSPAVSSPTQVQAALSLWRDIVGESHVRCHNEAEALSRTVVKPFTANQLQRCVEVAALTRTPIYPVSTGKNWGYGSDSPITSDSVVFDLSGLTRIELLDKQLGLVTVEPGVTQQSLYDFLRDEDLPFMVPVHGGGPDCSILGNALERGYGLTPETDHFGSLRSIEAILADGSIYRSPMTALGVERTGACHRWGIGPFVDGLFSQGNFGVVTRGTIALASRPELVEAFFLRVPSLEVLQETIECMREILANLGAMIGGVNFMNDRRVLSMSKSYPVDQVPAGQIIPDELCASMTRQAGIPCWTGAGIIHCPKSMIGPIRHEISKKLPKSLGWPIFINRQRLSLLTTTSQYVPIVAGMLKEQLGSIKSFLDIADGIPSRVALPLAYWLSGKPIDKQSALDPGRDRCGLLWYSPLVPMTGEDVQAYTTMVDRICRKYAIEPLITLTSLSHRLFDSTVPLLYRSEETGAQQRAEQCYEELFDAGRALGYLPYRVGVKSMSKLTSIDDGTHWSIVERIKQSLDPDDLISPGRYCPTQR